MLRESNRICQNDLLVFVRQQWNYRCKKRFGQFQCNEILIDFARYFPMINWCRFFVYISLISPRNNLTDSLSEYINKSRKPSRSHQYYYLSFLCPQSQIGNARWRHCREPTRRPELFSKGEQRKRRKNRIFRVGTQRLWVEGIATTRNHKFVLRII